MKKEHQKLFYFVFAMSLGFAASAQVGIGTKKPNSSSQLEIVSEDKGILIPRISLTSLVDLTTISNGNIESLLIYNTNVTTELIAGYYFWSKDRWHHIATDDEKNSDKVKMIDNGNGTYSFIDGDGKVTVINKSVGETLTSLVVDPRGTLSYKDEKGETTVIKVADLESLTSLALNTDKKNLNFTDEKGVVTKIDMQAVVKNLETETKLTKNDDGTFTYINENGTSVTIEGFGLEVVNGVTKKGQNLELGGSLNKPTQIISSATNTLAIEGLQQGGLTDNIVVVDSATGVLKSLPATSFNNLRKIQIYIAKAGQNSYAAPFQIFDKDKVQVFRNGVQIDFNVTTDARSVTLDFSGYAEDNITSCFAGDEIKIFQWK